MYIEATLWERYHWAPDVLDRQEAGRVLGGTELLSLGEVSRRFAQDQTKLDPAEYKMIEDLVGIGDGSRE